MSRALTILLGAAFAVAAPSALFAVDLETVWQLGQDDAEALPFETESWNPNTAPGSPSAKDDDYYFAGTYPAPIGPVAGDEPANQFERAITQGDPRVRLHFPLPETACTAESRLTLTLDFHSGGAWVSPSSLPGFQTHDIVVRFNGHPILTRADIHFATTFTIAVPASSVSAATTNNVIEIERTGGAAGGYLVFDYLQLEAEPFALRDADEDGLPLWFETEWGLDDEDPADAAIDTDGDGLDALAEFAAGTYPSHPDTDNDGLADGDETTTNPLVADTDGDGLVDGDETSSSPTLADTDADGFSDNFEIKHGTDPDSSASHPFPFAGAVGFHFISSRPENLPLSAFEPAGVVRLPHWNASDWLPVWGVGSTPTSGSAGGLVDALGQASPVTLAWTHRNATAGYHKGGSDERLANGCLAAARAGSTNIPVLLEIDGIPYATYDLILYVGDNHPNHRGRVRLDDDPATDRFFVSHTAPPFPGWIETTATTEADIAQTNVVRYRGLTGASHSVQLSQLDNDQVSLHGLQIVDTGTDSDSDDLADSLEIEHGFDPAVPDSHLDADGDGLENADELIRGTDPHLADTDHDGIVDGDEDSHGTDPLLGDTDGDTLPDGTELTAQPFPSSPVLTDTDNDTFTDDLEVASGSDPGDPSSIPAPAPIWDSAIQGWRWRIDNLRIRWDHRQSMTGAINSSSTNLFEAIVEFDDQSWTHEMAMGLVYRNGVIAHRFRCTQNLFHYPGHPEWGIYATGSTDPANDLSAALGFSDHGDGDESHPLRLEMTAVRPDPGINAWTLTFSIHHLADPGSPTLIASRQWTDHVAVDPHLLDGSASWTSVDGIPGFTTFESEPGITPFLASHAVGTADSDDDGMPDTWETAHTFNPADPADATLDSDADTLDNLTEFLAGTDPHAADTDDDGISDATELALGTSPLIASSAPAWHGFSGNLDDLDNDGLSDAWSLWSGGKTRAALDDDDGDGMSNRAESEAGTDPDDPNSRLRMRSETEGDDLHLAWTRLDHKAHWLESSSDLAQWDPFDPPGFGLTPTEITATLPDALLAEPSYFRAGVGSVDSDGDGVEDWVETHVLFSDPDSPDSLAASTTDPAAGPLAGDARALLDTIASGTTGGGTSPSTSAPSPVHASRLLMQATFGPTLEEIDHVRTTGVEAWIDEQLSLPPSLLRPYIVRIKEDAAGPHLDRTYDYNEDNSFVTGSNITTPWARHAISAPDQLRQRVAFALSEILVISRRDAQLAEMPEALADYYDHLINGAFGSYADLLTGVALHPNMGWYLSHVGNQKADPSIPRYPDENFAREIMQLFTIGLWELNPDGTRKLDETGEPIPTYDNGDITELARVFTGLYYDAPYGWGGGGWSESHFLKPMVMWAEHHDFGRKELPGGVILPARDPSDQAGMQEVREAVQALVRHPNTAPFLSKHLIRFLVTDNPSPSYVGRVSSAFSASGGNLGETVRAILLDDEARRMPLDPTFGKVREPVIRTMHLARLGRVMDLHPDFVWWNPEQLYYGYSFQEPFYSPSVFNFFTPEYQAPGEIRELGLVSPGFQIIDSYSAISFPNRLWDYLRDGFISSWSGPRYPLDYARFLLDAATPEILVDRLNLLVCAGSMTARTRGLILDVLENTDLTREQRVALALWTSLTCPEGTVQR